MSNAPRKSSRRRALAGGIPTVRYHRCGCSPTRCRKNWWPSRAPESLMSSTSTPSSRPRARACWPSSNTRATCKSGWTSFAAGMRPRRWNTSRPARGGRSRIRGRAPRAVSPALVLVPAQCRGLSRNGKPASREAKRFLA